MAEVPEWMFLVDSVTMLSMSSTNLKRLGREVTNRRIAVGYRNRVDLARAMDLSDRVLADIEKGVRSVGAGTYALLENWLKWEPGSAKATLEGGAPTPIAANEPPPAPDRVDALDVGDGATAGIVDQAQLAWSRLIELADAHGDPDATFHAVIGSSEFYIDALLTMQAGPPAKPLLREIFNKVDEVIYIAKERKAHGLETEAESSTSSEEPEDEKTRRLRDEAERRAAEVGNRMKAVREGVGTQDAVDS